MIKSYKDLFIWQKSVTEYLKLIDKLTEIMKMIRSLSKNLEPKT